MPPVPNQPTAAAPRGLRSWAPAWLAALSLACAALLIGLPLFLDSPLGRDFNERVFIKPLWLAGGILMILLYGAMALGLIGLGFVAALLALWEHGHVRWLAWLALAASVAAPLIAGKIFSNI